MLDSFVSRDAKIVVDFVSVYICKWLLCLSEVVLESAMMLSSHICAEGCVNCFVYLFKVQILLNSSLHSPYSEVITFKRPWVEFTTAERLAISAFESRASPVNAQYYQQVVSSIHAPDGSDGLFVYLIRKTHSKRTCFLLWVKLTDGKYATQRYMDAHSSWQKYTDFQNFSHRKLVSYRKLHADRDGGIRIEIKYIFNNKK